uniref:VWFA domain-containing protein n=1 Tax=Caenorhabditis japonica TaxID=281687 RepID=A0A8R1E1A8_CAEJA
MDEMLELIKKLKVDFDKEQQWNRYVGGDILYDVIDEKSANTVNSYVSDSQNDLSLDETHKYFDFIMKKHYRTGTEIWRKKEEKASTFIIENIGICPPILDIIILFDTSGGNDTVVQQQKNWTIQIVRELPIHKDSVRVGLIPYAEEARSEFNLSRYSERADIIKNLDTLKFEQGDTKTGVALYKADEQIFQYSEGARLKANRIIIVFTDGLSMDNPTKAAKALRRKGVKIYAISVNSIGFVPEMLGIVGDADNIFGPTDEDRLTDRLLSDVERARSCDVEPKRNEKTTSAFTSKTTELPLVSEESKSETEATKTPSSALSKSLEVKAVKPIDKSIKKSFAKSSSEEAKSSNSVEDISMDESTTLSSSAMHSNLNSKTSIFKSTKRFGFTTSKPALSENEASTPSSSSEPVQLFTVESKQENLLDQTNTEHTPTKKPFSSKIKNKEKLATSTTPETKSTTVTTITSTPTSTTVCITQPIVSSTVPSIRHSTVSSFLTKLGVKKEVDPVSKFLGRDVSNSAISTENGELNDEKVFEEANSAFEKSKQGTTSSKTSVPNTSENDKSDSRSDSKVSPSKSSRESTTLAPTTTASRSSTVTRFTTISPSTKEKTRFAFSTRVTHRPIFPLSSKSSTTTTAPSSSVPSSTTPATSTRKWTPTRSPTATFNTLASITAFPTLLSMEKAVTLPVEIESNGSIRHMKKKIRRIIKRRRNILPASLNKKVTETVPIVKHEPTQTISPVRSILKSEVAEVKEEEVAISGVQCPMDILFVVDSSGSIARTYDTHKDYLTLLIKKVEPSRSHRVGLIQFAGPHIQKMEWSFDSHSKNSQLLSAIRSVRHLTGTTYIGAALELSLILLDSRRKHTETTVILISDGFSQDDSTQQAKLLRQLPNVKMYAISLNKLTNTKYLTDIVGDRKNLFINNESKWFEEFFTKKLRCIPTRK